tara:strand:- start:48 stop:536 length:489 start_codon:yes stop_codon:yes gene_type:complete
MKAKALPKLELLKELFSYNEETGALVWKVSRGGHKAGSEAGGLRSNGYRRLTIDGEKYYVHRILYYLYNGIEPEEIDHINGLRSDNRIGNLRSVSLKENNRNQKKYSNNKSGAMGVHHHKSSNKWQTTLGKIYLGLFSSLSDALSARKQAEKAAGYHTNHGR